jgi:hypothetical protein
MKRSPATNHDSTASSTATLFTDKNKNTHLSEIMVGVPNLLKVSLVRHPLMAKTNAKGALPICYQRMV